MLEIEVTIRFKSRSDVPPVKAKLQEVLTSLSALHEPDMPPDIASVRISTVEEVKTPVVQGTFYTDTFTIR